MSMKAPRDPMSVVERAYELTGPEERWVAGLLAAAAPLLAEGPGIWGCVVDLASAPPQRSAASVGGDADWQRTWRSGGWERAVLSMPREVVAASISFGPVAYASHVGAALGQQIDTFEQLLAVGGSKGIAAMFGRRVHHSSAISASSLA